MKENKITLYFDNNITCLADFEYGKQIFEQQASDLDFSKDMYIELPDQIESVASSFVNGFFEKVVEEIGLDSAEERIHIISSDEDMEDDIKEKLIFGYAEAVFDFDI